MEPSIRDERGGLNVIWVAPDVMCTTLDGHCANAFVDVHMREASAAYARGTKVRHYFDAAAMTSYDSEARVRLTDFAVKKRKYVREAVFLLPRQNRLVTMGVTTAALAARLVGLEFEVLYQREPFEARLKAAAQARPTPTRPAAR